jgi:hypothetical protein
VSQRDRATSAAALPSLALALAFAALSSGCATAVKQLPLEQRGSLERTLTGQERFLALSFYVTPFFGDSTLRLLTAWPPDEVRLLDSVAGRPINPGPVEAVLPAGSRARILKIEFPSALVQAGRVLLTPRSSTWVYLDVALATDRVRPADTVPLVLVLGNTLGSEVEVLAELERSLSVRDLAPQLAQFSPQVREAIAKKATLPEMPTDAVLMAWGPPESRNITRDGEQRRETWVWPGGKRRLVIKDGRVEAP